MYVTNKKLTEKRYFSILVSKSIQNIFNLYRQTGNTQIEACGILIGNHKIDGSKIYLKSATIPQIKDTRKRYSFRMDSSSHQTILEKCFKESKNEDVYLGTWHTHPENDPMPSKDDIESWKKQYKINKKLFNQMIFTIVGIKKVGYWMIENNNLFELSRKEIVYEDN